MAFWRCHNETLVLEFCFRAMYFFRITVRWRVVKVLVVPMTH